MNATFGIDAGLSARNQDVLSSTAAFVRQKLEGAEGGHDWFHIERVYRNAMRIASGERCDKLVVALGALLHDVADSKFNDGDESIGPRLANDFLQDLRVNDAVVRHVVNIVKHVSFKGGHSSAGFASKELDVVRDADRLDAIGAIGIARAFNYGGFKNRAIYDPAVLPNLSMTKEEYKASTAPTLNHFYEKLLLLKDLMATDTGRSLAQERHEFMLKFLDQFYGEWNGHI